MDIDDATKDQMIEIMLEYLEDHNHLKCCKTEAAKVLAKVYDLMDPTFENLEMDI